MNHELYHGLIVFHLFGFLNTQMFSAGLKLMVVGMLMVLLFLLAHDAVHHAHRVPQPFTHQNGSPEDSAGKEDPETERFPRTSGSCSGFGSSSIRIRG